MAKDPDQYSDKEAKARFEAALRGGLSTAPKPLKDIPTRDGESRPVKRKVKVKKKPGK